MAGKTVILIMAGILAERVGISKGTLSAIEKGESTVSIGAYASVLNALDMANDFDYVAVDREGKQCYKRTYLYHRKRATKRKEGGERI